MDSQSVVNQVRDDKYLSFFWKQKPTIRDSQKNTLRITFEHVYSIVEVEWHLYPSSIGMKVSTNFSQQDVTEAIILSKSVLFYLFSLYPMLQDSLLGLSFIDYKNEICTFHWDETTNFLKKEYTEYVEDILTLKKLDYLDLKEKIDSSQSFTFTHPAYFARKVTLESMQSSFEDLLKQFDFFNATKYKGLVDRVYGSLHNFKFLYHLDDSLQKTSRIEFYTTNKRLNITYLEKESLLDMIPPCSDIALVIYVCVLYCTLLGYKKNGTTQIVTNLIQTRNKFPTFVNEFFTINFNYPDEVGFLASNPSPTVCSLVKTRLLMLERMLSLYSIEYPEQVFEF